MPKKGGLDSLQFKGGLGEKEGGGLILQCTLCCCRVCAGAPSCYLDVLDKLHKRIYRTVGPSVAGSFAPLLHHQNAGS